MSSAFPDLQAPDVEFSTSSIPPMTPREPVDLPAVINSRNMSFSKAEIEQQTTDLLAVAERLIETFATMSASSPAFVELLSPVLSVLDGSKTGKLSPALKDLHSSTTSNLSRMLEHARSFRRPLAMQAHKPVPIASYAPKFEDDFAPGRHYDPDSERNSSAKVRALYKKERKGAIRELRKDNRFLAGEKAREQRDKDSAYDTRMRRVEGEINSERAEEKAMQR